MYIKVVRKKFNDKFSLGEMFNPTAPIARIHTNEDTIVLDIVSDSGKYMVLQARTIPDAMIAVQYMVGFNIPFEYTLD